ncbi:50S ribosomal protein L10 [Achromatium sp. WMS2]|nr:50S ribosomal protein L10 [Achromatium sp. WMS2]
MALTLIQKQEVVSEIADIASKALSAVAAEYRGLTVEQMTKLRSEARNAGVYLQIVKNTLARRALEGTAFACMQKGLVGPLILGFSLEDPGAVARVMKEYAATNEKFSIRLVAFGGKLLAPDDLDTLASLPTYDQAVSKLIALLQAPVAKLVRTINEVPGKLVRTLAAIREAKEQQNS